MEDAVPVNGMILTHDRFSHMRYTGKDAEVFYCEQGLNVGMVKACLGMNNTRLLPSYSSG